VAACYEHGNELSGSIKGGEFLDCLSNYQLVRMDPAPWSYLVNMNQSIPPGLCKNGFIGPRRLYYK
jgi:hypothetical protein